MFAEPNYEKPVLGKVYNQESAPIFKDADYPDGVTLQRRDGVTYLRLKIDGFDRFDETFGWVILFKESGESNIEIFTP